MGGGRPQTPAMTGRNQIILVQRIRTSLYQRTILATTGKERCHVEVSDPDTPSTTLSLFEKLRSCPTLPTLLHRAMHSTTSLFLPVGYPKSVHPNYAPFVLWNFIQSCCGSTTGVIATQCLLFGLGVSKGSAASGIAMAATLNWILKDGFGQIGGVIFVAIFGHRFDVEAKKYRFLASLCMAAATLAEIFVPLCPTSFLLVAATANALKNIAWIATSATRAQIQRHLCKQDNMGDIVGKAASQNTLASLLGTAAGALISSIFFSFSAGSMGSSEIISKCLLVYFPVTLLYLYSSYKSCCYAISPRLTVQRLQLIVHAALPNLVSREGIVLEGNIGELHRYVLPVENISQRESFLWFRQTAPILKGLKGSEILVEPLISDFVVKANLDSQKVLVALLEPQADQLYIILANGPDRIGIWFHERAKSVDILRGLFTAFVFQYFIAGGGISSEIKSLELAKGISERLCGPFLESLQLRHWHIDEIELDRRRPFCSAPPDDKQKTL